MAGFATWKRFAGHPGRSSQTRHALRLKQDHFIGAGQQGAVRKAFRNYISRDKDKYLVKSLLEAFFENERNFDLQPKKRGRKKKDANNSSAKDSSNV